MFWRKKSEDNNINLVEEVSLLKEVVNKQSILIEDLVKENKGLLENYEEVNDNIGKLTNKVEDNISKLINVAEYNFQEVKDQLNLQNEIEGIPKNDEPTKTYRKYPQVVIKMIPLIIEVKKDGTLITKSKRIAAYTMYDLLKIVKHIPNKQDYPTWTSLSRKIGLNVNTLQRLCAGIELGYYDNIFKEWQKIQNTITKPDVIYVNNPEKRKELGMGGY